MNITLEHLQKLWDEKRIERIKKDGMHLSSAQILFKKYSHLWMDVDAVWENQSCFEMALRRRKMQRKKYDGCQHIFVSEICNIAIEEYLQVAKIMGNNKITLYVESYHGYFIGMSKKILKDNFDLHYYNIKRGELTANSVMV